mmetsp:Transcript_111456/g.347410  ORF Transcript_111456/g.347410 Transcript_111456/m.347410 type:complete len:284 (+) Transcript_111456:124-975(+)
MSAAAGAAQKHHAFEVEYAKSSMATCRVCMARIPKGALRLAHLLVGSPVRPEAVREEQGDAPAGEGGLPKKEKRMAKVAAAARWHHFECFDKMKGARWMAANLPASPQTLQGFTSLQKQDQQRLKDLWQAILMGSPGTASKAVASKRKADDSAQSVGAKRGKADRSAVLAKLTSVQGVLAAKDFKAIQKLERELLRATTSQLQAELIRNNQVRSGKKEELVQRVAEGRHLGALPPCPRCEKGHLHWSRVGGWYSCPGHFDEAAKIQKRCNFRTQELKRIKWQT